MKTISAIVCSACAIVMLFTMMYVRELLKQAALRYPEFYGFLLEAMVATAIIFACIMVMYVTISVAKEKP